MIVKVFGKMTDVFLGISAIIFLMLCEKNPVVEIGIVGVATDNKCLGTLK